MEIPSLDEMHDRIQKLRIFHRHAWRIKQDDLAFDCMTDECHNQVLFGKLWIGDYEAQKNFPSPTIKAVVSIGKSYCDYETHPDVSYFSIYLNDHPNEKIGTYFDEAHAFIRKHIVEEGHGVLVHCQAGVSRSATICIAYLIKEIGLTFLQAYCCVKEARGLISPNVGFVQQLLIYEKNCLSQRI